MVIHDRAQSHLSNRTKEKRLCRLKIFMIVMGIFLVAVVLPSYVLSIDISNKPLVSGSAASVSVNGEVLSTSTVLYQASYNPNDWTGDVTAFRLNPITGEVLKGDGNILWRASVELQDINWNARLIVTYDGTSGGTPFRFDRLTKEQTDALDQDPTIVEYLRGNDISGFRNRTSKLGDIVHSAPLLMGDTIFVGANDGMLHAFNAENGRERFAYVPNLVFKELKGLTKTDYDHRFFVDLTPVAVRGVGKEKITLLVGGLGKGGKGYYALNVTVADDRDPSSSTEDTVADMVLWEYPRQGTTDNDLGFTFSRAFIVRYGASPNEWVIIFGNGYESEKGRAVLYILDLDGNLIKKIDTGVGDVNDVNGLSTPALVDVNGDFIVDYAYAGDLKGYLWKFDLTDPDPANWEVAFSDGNEPKPLFQAKSLTGPQPITTKPDVMRHPERHGFIVVFGTGKFLSTSDRSNVEVQTLYGIWDYGDDEDDSEFLGSFDRTNRPLSNQPNYVTLLKQIPTDFTTTSDIVFRTLTNFTPNWETLDDLDNPVKSQNPNPGSDVCSDGDGNLCIVHAGWFIDLPNTGERIIKDPMIREGRAIVLSYIPMESGEGNSVFFEIDAGTGGRVDFPLFDIDYNLAVNNKDQIDINTGRFSETGVPPSGIRFAGVLSPPVILGAPGETEIKLFSSSSGAVEKVTEVAEKKGIYYWIER